MTLANQIVRHATCVAIEGKGVLICGISGSGKSGLALELIGYGARLVSDDRTELRREGDEIRAKAPEAIRGQIEARGVGILHAETVEDVPITLVIDLDQQEKKRLPPNRTEQILGQTVPLLHRPGIPYFAASILQYLKGGRSDKG